MDRQTPVLTSDEFGKFFSEYKNRFVSIAYGYVHDTDIAKDIVTDSFMYLWEHREQVNMAENIKGYIYFCVRTRCANHIKEQEVLRRAKNEITKDAYWKLQSSLNSLSSDELSKNPFQSEIIETIFLSAGIYDSFILLYPNWFFQFMTGSLSLYIYF